MIPVRLTVRHFLSYAQATLDLSAVHTACIYGANGAGKSALLEALTWGLWGQCRVGNTDALIRQGAVSATVDCVYTQAGQTYRVLRSRSRGGHSRLEWQIQAEAGGHWRVLTHKTQRATQQAITEHLKLDYETFINTAYLRQGRADEFTLKRPGDRKRLLADMLDLHTYDQLAEQCREQARNARVQVDFLQHQAQTLQHQLAQLARLTPAIAALDATLATLHGEHADARATLAALQQVQQHQQRRQLLRQQLESLDLATTESQWRQQLARKQDLQALCHRSERIHQGYAQWQRQQYQVQTLNALQQQHQHLRSQLHSAEQQWHDQQRHAELEQQKWQLARSQLEVQHAADLAIVAQAESLQTAIARYRQAQAQLAKYERLQSRTTPLLDQLALYQTHVDQERDRLLVQQTSLQQQLANVATTRTELETLTTALQTSSLHLDELQRLRVYQQRLLSKGQERRAFVAQLQAQQRSLQEQWQRLSDQQRQLLATPEGNLSFFTPCPLCEHPLEPLQRQHVVDRQGHHLSEITEDLWVIREQLAVSDREIEVLRREYQAVSSHIAQFDHQLAEQGRWQQQLSDREVQLSQLDRWQTELSQVTTALEQGLFAETTQVKLQAIRAELAQLGYDEKDHALWRSEVNRWRWAALKYAELAQARDRLQHSTAALAEPAPTPPEPPATLAAIAQAIKDLGYDAAAHQAAVQSLATLETWVSQWQALQQAQTELDHCQTQCQHLATRLHEQRQRYSEIQQHLAACPEAPANLETQVSQLKAQLDARREMIDQKLAERGALDHQQQQRSLLEQELQQLQSQLSEQQHNLQVWQELNLAYGANGIPAMIIETVLPELEAEANKILNRLSHNQLHLTFVTQRQGRRTLIDTLDILIADVSGTRPYESYSGGEAFRINFAIRLALSRLLAHRSGATLQSLWIDEGFGSQDEVGRDQLVAAINAVASDFTCILVITHLPSLRDRFPTRIQIERSDSGSQVQIIH